MKISLMQVGNLATNCYFLANNGEIAIVDPGGDSEKILEKIGDLDGEVKCLILTHYHPDHIEAVPEIKRKTGAPILIHKEDEYFLGQLGLKADKFIGEGDRIRVGGKELKVIHTPGHTEGSVCLLGEGFIITGDTLFENGHGRTDLPGGSPNKMKRSLDRLYGMATSGTDVYPGHGNSFKFF